MGSIHGSAPLIIRQKSGNPLSDPIVLTLHFFKESLKASVMGVGLGRARKSGG